MGLLGSMIGTIAGQLAGAWAYWRVRSRPSKPPEGELSARLVAGFVTTIVASLLYVPLGVPEWLGGDAACGLTPRDVILKC
jgi:hypothetical protein